MKKVILIPIIVGSVLLTVGGVLLAVGIVESNKVSQREEKTFEINDDFHKIDINISTADLEFVSSEGDKKQINYTETNYDKYDIKIEDDTLKIQYADKREWYQKIFSWNLNPLKVNVQLPSGHYGDLTIKTATGDSKIPNNFSFDNINYTASTGDLLLEANVTNSVAIVTSTGDNSIKGINPNSLSIKASTGKINIENVAVAENIVTEVSTGNTSLTNVTAKELKVTASTGKVNLNNVQIQGNVNISTDTGDVNFSDFDGALLDNTSINISTHTGDIKGQFLTSKIFVVHNKTGSPKCPESTTGNLCKIETHTGKIVITIKE